MTTGLWIMWIVIALIAGAVAGYFLARWMFKNEMKKNPPVSEKMIRAMFISMGRKPSEAQIRATMKSMNSAN